MIGRGRNLSVERDELTVVVKSLQDIRLDHYLMSNLAWKSRNQLQRLIREGIVRVGGETTKASRKVRMGDVITLALSSGVGIPDDYENRELEVVYEDPWIVAVNKPADLLVHPVGRHVYDTLINYLHHRYHQSGDETEAVVPRLCHRIDKDTTGLVVVAKNQYVHREVQFQFENRLVSKRYMTIVRGTVEQDETTIEIPIGEGRCLRSALEHETLKPSRTTVRVEKRFGTHSLLRCVPHTGRQNQIRIHLSAIGYPVAGDARFGHAEVDSGFPERHLLHSEFLRFYHPRLKTFIELTALPPQDLRELVDELSQSPPA